jgi:hypothetical protein
MKEFFELVKEMRTNSLSVVMFLIYSVVPLKDQKPETDEKHL